MTVTQLTVGTSTPVPITLQSPLWVKRLTIREDGAVSGYPLTRWQWWSPTQGQAQATTMVAGSQKDFLLLEKGGILNALDIFPPVKGQTVLYIIALDASSTFDQIEEP